LEERGFLKPLSEVLVVREVLNASVAGLVDQADGLRSHQRVQMIGVRLQEGLTGDRGQPAQSLACRVLLGAHLCATALHFTSLLLFHQR
jgi:hypothetical protein